MNSLVPGAMKCVSAAVLAVSVVVAWAGAGGAPALGAARPAGSWGQAAAVPGLAALNKGRDAAVLSVSCASAGNCAAGGDYRRGHVHGFVAVERHGRWGRAAEVPGLAALNAGGFAEVTSVSCAAPGSCAAGGYYHLDRHGYQGFVAVERHGQWGQAIEVPGLAALNKGGDARVWVSCAGPGDCAAGGFYTEADHENTQGFVAVERHGRWGRAVEVPGLAALNAGGFAEVTSVSCPAPGSCAVGGDYTQSDGETSQGFVAVDRNGRWGQAIEVPGLGTLNAGRFAEVISVSCAAPGSCAAGGDYTNRSGKLDGFVVSEPNGVWGRAVQVPGLGALNAGRDALVRSVSCGSAGNCVAGGVYRDGTGSGQGFVAAEQDGVWGQAVEVPGLGTLNTGNAGVTSVSCASAGNCVAGGDYRGHSGGQGFLAVDRDGVWGQAIEVPGLGMLAKGGQAGVNSVSCAPAATCAAGGGYSRAFGHAQGFVVSQTG